MVKTMTTHSFFGKEKGFEDAKTTVEKLMAECFEILDRAEFNKGFEGEGYHNVVKGLRTKHYNLWIRTKYLLNSEQLLESFRLSEEDKDEEVVNRVQKFLSFLQREYGLYKPALNMAELG